METRGFLHRLLELPNNAGKSRGRRPSPLARQRYFQHMSVLFGAAVGLLALVLGSGAAGQTPEEQPSRRMSGDSEIAVSRRARTESLETLPRWPTSEEYLRGPLQAGSLQTDGQCYSIGEVLSAVPELSLATQLLKDAGYTKTLLNDRKVMSTLVLPVNAAFWEPLDGNEYGRNMSAVISARPDIMNSLVGSSVWKGLWTSNTFSGRGTPIPTSNKLGSEGSPMTVTAFSGRGGFHVEAQGSDASVLASDLAACGPSVIHIVNSFLLPFDWDDDARDRTQLDNGQGGVTTTSDGDVGRSWGGWGGWGGRGGWGWG